MSLDFSGKAYYTSRFPARERDLEERRMKGEAACAECKRLKLKCDRKNPCSSCVRRGCQPICPNGSLASGHGTRFVLANTDKLHVKLLEMSKRIRQLEDALQLVQATVTSSRHPLLSEDLLSIKSGVDIVSEEENLEGEDVRYDDFLYSELGMLSISERGEACFMGKSSGEALLVASVFLSLYSHVLMSYQAVDKSTANEPRQEKAPLRYPNLPSELNFIGESFPFTHTLLPKQEILQAIQAHLPSYARATALVEAYLGNIFNLYSTVDRKQIFEELLPAIYRRNKTHEDHTKFKAGIEADDGDYVHQLALFLSTLAVGALGDLTLPIGNSEADTYVRLARAALSINSVFVKTSMDCVQAMIMLALYDFAGCQKSWMDPTWKMISASLSLASSMGLHRDPARWKMNPKLIQRRRTLFWDMYTLDKWKSMESGRPATFNSMEIDCEFPEDTEASISEDGSVIPSLWRWKYRLTKEVVAPMAEQLCSARPIKYEKILELDRKLRDFEVHPSLKVSANLDPDDDQGTIMHRYNWTLLRESALLFLHRNYFARAMLESPQSPGRSPFFPSALSAVASSLSLVNLLRVHFEIYPELLVRQRIIWISCLSAIVIIGTVACRVKSSHICTTCIKELEAVVDLFSRAQVHPVPRTVLPSIQHLLDRARKANLPAHPKVMEDTDHGFNMLGGAPLFLNSSNTRQNFSIDAQSLPSYGSSQTGRGQSPPLTYYEPAPADTTPSSRRTSSWPYLQSDQAVFASGYEPNSSAFTASGNENTSVGNSRSDNAPANASTVGSSQAYKPSGAPYTECSEAPLPFYTSGAKSHDDQSSGSYTYPIDPGPGTTPWQNEYSGSTYSAEPVHQGSSMHSNFNSLDSASFIMNEGHFQVQGVSLDDREMTSLLRSLIEDPEYFDTVMSGGLL